MSVLSTWWVCTTLVGVLAIAGTAATSLSGARAQACADAVALALTERSTESIGPLLSALGARLASVTWAGDEVTVTVDSRWGTARATATIGS